MTWSPLACGIISGKYGNGVPESSRASLKVFSPTSRKESGDGRRGWKKFEQNSSAAACGFLAQAEHGLSQASVIRRASPSPEKASAPGPSISQAFIICKHRKFSSSAD